MIKAGLDNENSLVPDIFFDHYADILQQFHSLGSWSAIPLQEGVAKKKGLNKTLKVLQTPQIRYQLTKAEEFSLDELLTKIRQGVVPLGEQKAFVEFLESDGRQILQKTLNGESKVLFDYIREHFSVYLKKKSPAELKREEATTEVILSAFLLD